MINAIFHLTEKESSVSCFYSEISFRFVTVKSHYAPAYFKYHSRYFFPPGFPVFAVNFERISNLPLFLLLTLNRWMSARLSITFSDFLKIMYLQEIVIGYTLEMRGLYDKNFRDFCWTEISRITLFLINSWRIGQNSRVNTKLLEKIKVTIHEDCYTFKF